MSITRREIEREKKMAETDDMVELTMNGGNDIHSYSKNSNFQVKIFDVIIIIIFLCMIFNNL